MSKSVREIMIELPFVSKSADEKINLWAVSLLDDGCDIADRCIDFMIEHAAPCFLSQVHKAQMQSGLYGATEISFWNRIAERASVPV